MNRFKIGFGASRSNAANVEAASSVCPSCSSGDSPATTRIRPLWEMVSRQVGVLMASLVLLVSLFSTAHGQTYNGLPVLGGRQFYQRPNPGPNEVITGGFVIKPYARKTDGVPGFYVPMRVGVPVYNPDGSPNRNSFSRDAQGNPIFFLYTLPGKWRHSSADKFSPAVRYPSGTIVTAVQMQESLSTGQPAPDNCVYTSVEIRPVLLGALNTPVDEATTLMGRGGYKNWQLLFGTGRMEDQLYLSMQWAETYIPFKKDYQWFYRGIPTGEVWVNTTTTMSRYLNFKRVGDQAYDKLNNLDNYGLEVRYKAVCLPRVSGP